MPRISLLLIALTSLGIVGCSKQAATGPAAAPTTAPSEAAGPGAPAGGDTAAAATKPGEEPGVGFSLAGSPETSNSTKPSLSDPASQHQQVAMSPEAPGTQPPQLVERVIPFYPLSLRIQGIEGRVDVSLLIGASGSVQEAEVINSTEARLSEFAVAALRQARFEPARKDGQAVEFRAVLPVVFASEFGSGSMPARSPLADLVYLDGLYYRPDPTTGRLALADTKQPVLLLSQVAPPPASRKAGEKLHARVKMTITEEGQVLNPTVLESTNEDFSRNITQTFPFWQFIPRFKAGKAVSTIVEIPYDHK